MVGMEGGVGDPTQCGLQIRSALPATGSFTNRTSLNLLEKGIFLAHLMGDEANQSPSVSQM